MPAWRGLFPRECLLEGAEAAAEPWGPWETETRSSGTQKGALLREAEGTKSCRKSHRREDRHQSGEVAGGRNGGLLHTLSVRGSLESKTHEKGQSNYFKWPGCVWPAGAQKKNSIWPPE